MTPHILPGTTMLLVPCWESVTSFADAASASLGSWDVIIIAVRVLGLAVVEVVEKQVKLLCGLFLQVGSYPLVLLHLYVYGSLFFVLVSEGPRLPEVVGHFWDLLTLLN